MSVNMKHMTYSYHQSMACKKKIKPFRKVWWNGQSHIIFKQIIFFWISWNEEDQAYLIYIQFLNTYFIGNCWTNNCFTFFHHFLPIPYFFSLFLVDSLKIDWNAISNIIPDSRIMKDGESDKIKSQIHTATRKMVNMALRHILSNAWSIRILQLYTFIVTAATQYAVICTKIMNRKFRQAPWSINTCKNIIIT